jgi:hypothetical protein
LAPAYGAAGASIALSLAVVAHVMVLIVFLQPSFALDWLMLVSSAVAGVVGLGLLDLIQTGVR